MTIRTVLPILLITLLTAGTASAVNLLKGSRELGVGGLIDFDTVDGTLISLDVSYGYFWADFVESGLRVGGSNSDSVTIWRLGGFTEYNFFSGSTVVPYLGASIDILGSKVELAEQDLSETAVGVGGDLGVKIFITESIAISTQLGLDAATADVYPTEDGGESVNWDLSLGMRFFF